jgi:hypothetical protein
MLKTFFKKSRNSNKNYASCQIPINMSDSENFTLPHHAINSLYSFTWSHHAISMVFRLFTTLNIVSTTLLGHVML